MGRSPKEIAQALKAFEPVVEIDAGRLSDPDRGIDCWEGYIIEVCLRPRDADFDRAGRRRRLLDIIHIELLELALI